MPRRGSCRPADAPQRPCIGTATFRRHQALHLKRRHRWEGTMREWRPERPTVLGPNPQRPPQFVVLVHRCAGPPLPWAWAIQEEGEAEALRRSTERYRSAEDAWTAG